MKKYIQTLFTLLLVSAQGVCGDVLTENMGEQAMTRQMRTVLDEQWPEQAKNIRIGAGDGGAKAFVNPPAVGQKNLLLTWQLLERIKDMAGGTIIIVPKHAFESSPDFASMGDRFHLVRIDGVLHTMTKEKVMSSDASAIAFINPDMIVMLPGDTQQEDGSWKAYTKEMVEEFLTMLPLDKKILFLNGPRTGKYQYNEEGKLIVDETAHKSSTDAITQAVIDKLNDNWTIMDFKYGQTSAWMPVLKFLIENNHIPLVLAGESTSMISEINSLGIKGILLSHDAMTQTSQSYIKLLTAEGRAFSYPNGFDEGNYHQKSTPPQEDVIIKKLKSF